MGKIIFIGLIVWVVVVLIKRSLHERVADRPNAPTEGGEQYSDNMSAENNEKNHNIESMVQCDTCAVHLPRSEALMVNGRFYCSQLHIQQK